MDVEKQTQVIVRLEESCKALKEQEKRLRRAILVLRQAGEIELHHVYGETDSLWQARDTVWEFLQENGSVPTPRKKPDADTWESLGQDFVDFPEPDQTYGATD